MKSAFCSTAAVKLIPLLFVSLLAAQPINPTPAQANSTDATGAAQSAGPSSQGAAKVRIVRLSQIVGDVEVDRGTGVGFEPALLNLPIIEGAKLQTGSGFGEVEFEDNSTLRLTPYSSVAFTQLERSGAGATLSTITVSAGMVFVSLARTPGSEFALAFDSQKVSLGPSSHVRLDVVSTSTNLMMPTSDVPVTVVSTSASLAVLSGSVSVETPAGVTTISKKETLIFPNTNQRFTTSNNFESPYDAWDKTATEYHNRYAQYAAYGNSVNVFGLNDMNYYGRFVDAGDCGLIWRPYFATAAWDPFYNGSWVWYPSWGWTWVSPYPWGWAPYHYGRWRYCADVGWGWRPTGRWIGLPNYPKTPKPHQPVYGLRPVPPIPRPPQRGEPTTIRLNEPSAIVSGITRGRLVVRENSAGLGIPRDASKNLGNLSARVARHGVSSAALRSGSMWVSTGTEAPHEPPAFAGKVSEGGTRASGSNSWRAPASSSGSSRSAGYSRGESRSGYSGGSGIGSSSFSSSSGGHSGGGSMGSGGGGGGRR